MRSSVALSLLLLCIFVGATVTHPQQDSTKNSTEEEIRAARCDSYEGHSAAAQKRIEAVLITGLELKEHGNLTRVPSDSLNQ